MIRLRPPAEQRDDLYARSHSSPRTRRAPAAGRGPLPPLVDVSEVVNRACVSSQGARVAVGVAHRDAAAVPAADGGDRHGIVDPRAVDPRRQVQPARIASDPDERAAGARRRGVRPSGRRASQGHDAVGRKRRGTAVPGQDQRPGAPIRRPTRARAWTDVGFRRWLDVRRRWWPGVGSRGRCRYRPDVGCRWRCRPIPGLVSQGGSAGWRIPGRRGAGRRTRGDGRAEDQGQTAQTSGNTSQVNPPITYDDERTTASRAHPLRTVTDALTMRFLYAISGAPAAVRACSVSGGPPRDGGRAVASGECWRKSVGPVA